MIVPPFKHIAEGGAEFHCLGFAPVKYRPTFEAEYCAALGMYFCRHKDFSMYSRLSFAAGEVGLSYTHGSDSLEMLLLSAFLDDMVHPAGWRLFPWAQMGNLFWSKDYEDARRKLCLLLFYFRSRENQNRQISDSARRSYIAFDESAGRVAMGDSADEDKEIEKAVEGQSGPILEK